MEDCKIGHHDPTGDQYIGLIDGQIHNCQINLVDINGELEPDPLSKDGYISYKIQ